MKEPIPGCCRYCDTPAPDIETIGHKETCRFYVPPAVMKTLCVGCRAAEKAVVDGKLWMHCLDCIAQHFEKVLHGQ